MINYQLELEKIIEENIKNKKVPNLLLHSCCAPCSSYVLEYLSKYFKITVFYYNPNISSEEEYLKRKEEQIRFIKEFKFDNPVDIIEGNYDNEKYEEVIEGLETEKEGGSRCKKCYLLRLEETAKYAKNNSFDYFGTTLTVSPYKNANSLNEIGKMLEDKYDINYLYSDFKKKNGYKRSIELSSIYGLYRQNYCGCIYSRRGLITKVKCVETGYLSENCYIIENNDSCLIVDPGDDFEKIKQSIEKPVLGVLITHRHFDHIGALEEVLNEYKCELYDRITTEEKNYYVKDFSFNVIFNPGHSKDSVTYYFHKDRIMFTGDFIFKNDIGRCDLEGGDFTEMMESINKIKKYPNDIVIYPGHGPSTTLLEEKEKNIYFNN